MKDRKGIKLNLGCGGNYLSGYINIDYSEKYETDIMLDIGRERLPFGDDSVSTVISSHLIEHLIRCEGIHHLREVFRVLRPKGNFYLAFPDVVCIINIFFGNEGPQEYEGNHEWIIEALYESQRDKTTYHRYGYTKHTMKMIVKNIGFRIKREDFQQSECLMVEGKKAFEKRWGVTVLLMTK